MATSLTAKEVLIYLYAKKKGDWMAIYKAIADKEALPADLDACRSVIKKFLGEHPKIMTVVDPSFPDTLKKRTNPPFVLPFTGDEKIIDYDQIIAIEGEELCPSLTRHGIRHCFVDDRGWCHIRVPQYNTAKDEYEIKEVVLEEDRSHSFNTMTAVSRKAVATKGSKEFSDAFLSEWSSKSNLFALPGNSGCACNQLIKQGWHLCDTWSDLTFACPPDDPKEA